MNQVCITGRWTADPKITYSGEMCIARGTIAVDRRYKKEGEQSADFPNVVAFSKTAEHIEKYHKKGVKAEITGHIQTGKYTNKDNVTIYTTDVVIDTIGFAESKKESEAHSDAEKPTEKADEGFMNVDDDIDSDLPFC